MNKKDLAPREFKGPTQRIKKGLLIIYTGNGKGKTTAAFGAALRCLGRGYKVAVVQFIKGKWISGEIKGLEKFKNQVNVYTMGEGFTWETKDLDRDIALAEKGWNQCVRLLRQKKHDLYIFDELLYVLKYKFLNPLDVLKDLTIRSPKAHVILTGRDAPSEFIEIADLATEMKEVKHPYQKGIVAQPGIDF